VGIREKLAQWHWHGNLDKGHCEGSTLFDDC